MKTTESKVLFPTQSIEINKQETFNNFPVMVRCYLSSLVKCVHITNIS